MSTEGLLLIFVKNPQEGKVKTRLAEAVGSKHALQIYNKLLTYTRDVVKPLAVDIQVWYSDYIPLNDLWDEIGVEKRTQLGKDLGERMKHAFDCAFSDGYERVVIIGSDCALLTTEIIRNAFKKLETNDVTIGPSQDGGYYLLGMNEFYPAFFEDKEWSTSHVYQETMKEIEQRDLTFSTLPELNDVDTHDDWQEVKFRFANPS